MGFTPRDYVKWMQSDRGAPSWFKPDWPWSGTPIRNFYALNPRGGDEIIGGKNWRLDFEKIELAIGFAGIVNDSGNWSALYRQSLLAKTKSTWYLLLADPNPELIRQLDGPVDVRNCDVPLYLNLTNHRAEWYIESLMSLVPETEFESFEESKIGPSRAEKNLADLLIAWKVPIHEIWSELKNRFPDLKNLVPYLTAKGQLCRDGSHPAHSSNPQISVKLMENEEPQEPDTVSLINDQNHALTGNGGSAQGLENEQTQKLESKCSIDGLNLTLIWYGKSYGPLTQNRYSIVELLYKFWEKGVNWITLLAIREKLPTIFSIQQLSASNRSNGLAEVFTDRRKNEVGKRVRVKCDIWLDGVIQQDGGSGNYKYRLRPMTENPG